MLAEWMEYSTINPFSETRGDLRMAIVACLIANIHRRKGARAFDVDDFMPKFRTRPRRQTAQQMEAVMMAFAAAQNASVKRG